MTKTNALETLVISCWVRGLSDRDIEAMLAEVFGEEAKVSKATASRICQRLRAEPDAWKRRDLSQVKIDYLYLDGSFFKMHPRAKAEPVLAAWGTGTDGHAVFLGLGPGATESAEAWRGFLGDMAERGLCSPFSSSPTEARASARRSRPASPTASTNVALSTSAGTWSRRSPATTRTR